MHQKFIFYASKFVKSYNVDNQQHTTGRFFIGIIAM